MSWIFLALASNFSWAIENIYTKVVIGSKVKNPYVFLILLMVLSVVVLPFVPMRYILLPNINLLGWMFCASAIYTFGTFPYLKAMEVEEVTRINILWNTLPIFNLIIGWFLVGDKISGQEFLAMIVLISGAVLACIKVEKTAFKLSRAFWLMMAACILYSFYAVMIRFLSRYLPFYSIFFWTTFFNAILVLICLLYRGVRRDLVYTIKSNSKKFFLLFLVVVVISTLGTLFNQWALSLKSGALVYSFEGFQVLFVFGMALVVSKIVPGFIAESLDKKNLIIKITAFFVIIIGLILLM